MSKEMKSRELLSCRGCLNCDVKVGCKYNILDKVNDIVDEYYFCSECIFGKFVDGRGKCRMKNEKRYHCMKDELKSKLSKLAEGVKG